MSVALLARSPGARCSLFFLVATPCWPADHSSGCSGWQDDSWQDGSISRNGWQSDGGNGMYGGVQAAEGWGVRPGSEPQASKQLAWGHSSSGLAGRSSSWVAGRSSCWIARFVASQFERSSH